ncbi:MAG: rod-binding protein [Armatimonadetes bacterium]|nr:rod-binding protein [Armatimonadota bacterium]
MTKPPVMPGSVPSGIDSLIARRAMSPAPHAQPQARLRADFENMLKAKLDGWLGPEGSERRQALGPMVQGVLDGNGKFDIEKLPANAKTELVKLQVAAEGIEAIFVKQLLSQMRQVSFGPDSKGPMADFTKDMMDQTLAEQAAKGRSSVGIAKLVFLDSAEHIVRAAIAKAPNSQSETHR